ncbi:MAG: dUTP diphosphatase [Chitinophagaceae bacterium]|nr:dUTP diphosphatase [Chitinophagaceae bacterium]
MQKLSVKIINHSGHPLPKYETLGSSGMDLRANITEPIELESLERKLIPTGIFLEIPQGYEAQIRSRSGLAIKQGLICLNSPGTIDADYRGEIKIIIANLSKETVSIQNGDRIAQMVFQKIQQVELIEVEVLEYSERGSGGFGHTGI